MISGDGQPQGIANMKISLEFLDFRTRIAIEDDLSQGSLYRYRSRTVGRGESPLESALCNCL